MTTIQSHLAALRAHCAAMAPHQAERRAGKLLNESLKIIEQLVEERDRLLTCQVSPEEAEAIEAWEYLALKEKELNQEGEVFTEEGEGREGERP